MSQVCNKCDIDKNISEYYSYDGVKSFKICKQCISAARPKALKGFQKLPSATQLGIAIGLKDRRNTVGQIAEEWGVKYTSLLRWIKSGDIPVQ